MVVDVTYVGRMGLHLQRERNINQLQPGTVQANPGVNVNALRPYRGFAHHPPLGERRALALPRAADRPGAPLPQRPGLRRRLHALRLRDNADGKRDLLYNAYDDSVLGLSDNDRTHLFNIHYIYELPFWRNQDTLLKKILGGWQVSGVTYFQSGRPLSVGRADDARAWATRPAALEPGGGPQIDNPQFSRRTRAGPELLVQHRRLRAAGGGHLRQRRAQPEGLRGPGFWSWDIALFKNIPLGGPSACSSGWRRSTSSTTRTWATPTPARRRPLSASTSIPTAPTSDACSPRPASATSSSG